MEKNNSNSLIYSRTTVGLKNLSIERFWITKIPAIFTMILVLLLSGNSISQTFTFSGSITNENGTGESGIVVTAKGGASQSLTTNASGRYKLNLEYGKKYTIELTKPGFAKRFFVVDLSLVKEQDLMSGEDFADLNILMVKEVPGADLTALSAQPITTFTFSKNDGQLVKDVKQSAASDKALNDAKAKKEAAESNKEAIAKENQKKYLDKIKAGDQLMTAKDYAKAITAYEEAIELANKSKLDDTEAANKLDLAFEEDRKLREQQLKEQQENAEFFKLIEDGKKLEAKNELQLAKDKYEEALTKREGNKEAIDLIDKMNKAIELAATEEKRNADYLLAMNEAKTLFDLDQLEQAKLKYQAAQFLKSTEKEPPLKIAEIDKKINDKAKNAKKQAAFDELMKQALELQNNEKYDDAISKYTEAQLLIKDRTEPKAGIELCEQKKKEKADLAKNQAVQEKLDRDYAAAIQKADALFDTKKYAESIKEYQIAKALKPSEEHPISRIKDAQTNIAELVDADAKKKQFDQLVKDGGVALSQNKLAEAKEKYNAANAIISNDAVVLAKLQEIELKEAALLASQTLDNNYKNFMEQGENAIKNGSYPEAKNFFQEAKNLKRDEALPTERIAFVDSKILEMAADQAKKAQYDGLLASATTKEAASDLNGALVDLKKAFDLIKDEGLKNRITVLEKRISDLANSAKIKADYDAAIQKADLAFSNKEWENAIKHYKEAKIIDGSQTFPDEQIAFAQTELSKMQNAQERKNNFTKIFADAEKFFGDKKYAQADNTYQNALNYADDPADKDKTEKRRAEIKDILDKQEGIDRQKKNYNEAISAAQEFERSENLEQALVKYREATTFDPVAELPKLKEKELTTKIEEKNKLAANQAKFDAIILEGDNLFIAGKFDEAITKYTEGNVPFPNSTIVKSKIDEVKKKIKESQQSAEEQTYLKILSDAQNARDLKNYDDALRLYNQALTQRQNDAIPKQKIKEIQEEIEQNKRIQVQMEANRARYDKLIKDGYDFMSKDLLDQALVAYLEAERLMSTEAEPKQKIEQIRNIQATRQSTSEAERSRLAQIRELILAGDRDFGNEKYNEALQNYQDALALAEQDETIKKKIEITKERIVQYDKDQEELAWKSKMSAADKAFFEREYDVALAFYNEVLVLNAENKKAKEQIALIDRIKTPSSDIAELEDFGNPSYQSILEGEALLDNAERQREYRRLKLLRNQMVEIETKLDAQYAQEGLDVRGTYSTTKDMERERETFLREKKEQQLLTEIVVREILADITDAQLLENLLAYKDLIDMQFAIRTILEQNVEGVQGNYLIPNMNEEEINKYLLSITQNSDNRSLNHIELLLNNDAFVQDLYKKYYSDEDFSRILIDLNASFITMLMLDLDNVSSEQLLSQQEYLGAVLESLNDYAEFINTETQNNYEAAMGIHSEVQKIYESTREQSEQDQATHDAQRQDLLVLIKSVEQLLVEQNNQAIENQVNFQQSVVNLQSKQLEVQLALLRNNYLKLHLTDQELKSLMLYNTSDFELWLSDIKNAYYELKEIERLVLRENDRINEENQNIAYNNIKDINQLIKDKETKNSEDHTQQNAIAQNVVQIERTSGDAYQENLDKARQNINDNRAMLDKLDRREMTFNEATANALGEQFPEGVTEENYVILDDDGLVVEVKTRRIVVINGNGSVFMRYKNRYGVTFTKNGVSITEYLWTKETQNAKLPKYKVN